ncbi:MAG: DUF87 domain-containing protein [Nitrososphaerota archaeon]
MLIPAYVITFLIKSECGKTTTLIIINELYKFGKIIIIDFHGEYIGLKDLINAEIIKENVLSFDKMEKLKIEDMKALNNFENISIEKENKLKELGLIKLINGKNNINILVVY